MRFVHALYADMDILTIQELTSVSIFYDSSCEQKCLETVFD